MDCYKLLIATGLLVMTQGTYCISDCLEPDTRVIARWKNGNYYKGVVESLTNVISVLFDNGNRLGFNLHNKYDILEDREPDESEIKWGDPVIVHRPHSFAYKPAHVREIAGGRYMLWYDDGSYIYQTKNDIRVFNKSIVCNEPAYLGCYRDQVPRYLTVFIPTRPATVGACVDMCNAQGYSIAALRNTDLCFCGNAYNKGYQTENDKCDTPCFDNPFEMCGGAQTFSQYWTGIVGDHPVHVPGGLTANTALHLDPYGFRPSYSTAIAKQNIPRYGQIPWHSILLARKRSKAPMSLANTSPWRWDAKTKSWLRADGKHFRWDHNKLLESSMGTAGAHTYAIHNGLHLPGKTILTNLKPQYALNYYPKNNGMLPSLIHNKYPVQGIQQYKGWHTPYRSNRTMLKYASKIFANTFTPQRVLQKLADRMAHVKWTNLGTFLRAYSALPPAPATFRYLGCYADDYQRDLSHSFPVYPMTTRSCILTCRARRFSVAGIQASSQCYCGNSYSRYGRVREHECNMKCFSTRDTCGGVLRNSLYFTGVGSAWPKTPVSKKPASSSSTSKKSPQNLALLLSNDSSVKLPSTKSTSSNSHTKSHDNKKHGDSNHNNSTKAVKDKMKKRKKPAKLKIKARNKIVNSPTSTKQKPNFDDFQVESIKVKLNFSELKKALQTMSPSIVKRIQDDLQKINKLEHQKQLNKHNTTAIENKNLGTPIPNYKKQIKKIREKIDKVAVNHLTAQRMKDILKLIKIPESSRNIKGGVIQNSDQHLDSDQHIDKKRTAEDNLAHEEIESYAKISLDFPFKMKDVDQANLNRKRELLKILAKHVSSTTKDTDKKTTNQSQTSGQLAHKSLKKAAVSKGTPALPAFKKVKTTVQSLKSLTKHVKSVKKSKKKVKLVKIFDKQVKAVKASHKKVKPLKSSNKQDKPVKKTDKQAKPVKTTIKQVKSVKTSDNQVKPVVKATVKPFDVSDKQVKPVQTHPNKPVKTIVKQVKITDKQVKPVKKVNPVETPDKQIKPVQSHPDKAKPVKSSFDKQVETLVQKFTNKLKPIKSNSKLGNPLVKQFKVVKPDKPVTKQVTVIKSPVKQAKPPKSIKPLKSLDNHVKSVKTNKSKAKPVKSPHKKVTSAKSLEKPAKEVKSLKPLKSSPLHKNKFNEKENDSLKNKKTSKFEDALFGLTKLGVERHSLFDKDFKTGNKDKKNNSQSNSEDLKKGTSKEDKHNLPRKSMKNNTQTTGNKTKDLKTNYTRSKQRHTKIKDVKDDDTNRKEKIDRSEAINRDKTDSGQYSERSANYDKSEADYKKTAKTDTKVNKTTPTSEENKTKSPRKDDGNGDYNENEDRSSKVKQHDPRKSDNKIKASDTKSPGNEAEENYSGDNSEEKDEFKSKGKIVDRVLQSSMGSEVSADESGNKEKIDKKVENKEKMAPNPTMDTGVEDTKNNKEHSLLEKKIEKKGKMVSQPRPTSTSDDNGVIVLGDTPDDTSSYEESLATPTSQSDNEPLSGLSDIPNIDSSDENKLISFQHNNNPVDINHFDEDQVSEDSSGSFQDKQTPSLQNSPKQATKQLSTNNDSKNKIQITSRNFKIPVKADDNNGDDKSNYVYFGNGTIKPERLPLISKEDLKTLLLRRENAAKRSNAVSPQGTNTALSSVQNQTSPKNVESSSSKPVNVHQGARYTRSGIPYSKAASLKSKSHHSSQRKKGLRVVKNKVAFTVEKIRQGSQISKQKLLNSLRKQSKKLISKENNDAHKKRILHHISERTNLKKIALKDQKRDINDKENVEHSYHFRSDGVKNKLISQGI